jgi:hypothetical protein
MAQPLMFMMIIIMMMILSIEERVFKSAQRLSERTVRSSSAMGG